LRGEVFIIHRIKVSSGTAALLVYIVLLFSLVGCSRAVQTAVEEVGDGAVTPTLPGDLPAAVSPTDALPTALEATRIPSTTPEDSAVTPVIPDSSTPTGAGTQDEPALPPDPQRIDFTASDGQELTGTYFPAAVNPAPLVVLMHWAPGDACDWRRIAPWLQNREVEFDCPTSQDGAWLDSTWFPPIEAGMTYGVFTFTFRGCEGGCTQFLREEWALDAISAVQTARGLPGVIPDRIAIIGASIGADGAAIACQDGCQGAYSISPGDYLVFPYESEVMRLDSLDPPVPAVCLVSEGDRQSFDTCSTIQMENFTMTSYSGSAHGMMLIDPTQEPNPLIGILEFLSVVYDE